MIKYCSLVVVLFCSISVMGCSVKVGPLGSPDLDYEGVTITESYHGDRVTTVVAVHNDGWGDAYDVIVRAELYGNHGLCDVETAYRAQLRADTVSRFHITFHDVSIPPYKRHFKYYVSYKDRDGFSYNHRL